MIVRFSILRVLNLNGAMLSLGPFLGLFLMSQQPHSPSFQSASISGRVTYENRPVTGMMICLSLPGEQNTCYGTLQPDGSFELLSSRPAESPAPGVYRIHFEATPGGTKLPDKFFQPDSRELELQIVPGRNHIQVDLK
jgi:hypothetical protein